ncbi:hypothetical protein GOL34_13990 [Sinorhizobium medicae]|nr:hypothetical protein [Sinorhizobium medicae]
MTPTWKGVRKITLAARGVGIDSGKLIAASANVNRQAVAKRTSWQSLEPLLSKWNILPEQVFVRAAMIGEGSIRRYRRDHHR